MHLLAGDPGAIQLDASDSALIEAIQGGDRNSVGILFARYALSLQAIAHRVLHDRFEAEEVVQDIFSEIPSKCSTFDQNKGSVRSWLFKSAYYAAISRRRYLTSHWGGSQFGAGNVEQLSAKDQQRASVPPDLSSLETNNLRRLFRGLSENQRRTLELFFCEGYTLDEIAAESGQSKGNVRHYYFRGLEKLRKEVFCKKPQSPAV